MNEDYSKKNIDLYYTNHRAMIAYLSTYRFVVSKNSQTHLMVLIHKNSPYETALTDNLIRNGIFDSVISIDFSVGVNSTTVEDSLEKILEYYDNLVKKSGIDITKINMIYTMPDNINTIGIWASVRKIRYSIIEIVPNQSTWTWVYGELKRFGAAKDSFCELQKKHQVLTQSNYHETIKYEHNRYVDIASKVTLAEKEQILSAFGAKDLSQFNGSNIIILNSETNVSDQINAIYGNRSAVNKVSDKYYNKIYLDLMSYLVDSKCITFIKPHPMSFEKCNIKYFRKCKLMADFPIELMTLEPNIHINETIGFGSTAITKIKDISNKLSDYGQLLYNYSPHIHIFMFVWYLVANLKRRNIYTNLPRVTKVDIEKLVKGNFSVVNNTTVEDTVIILSKKGIDNNDIELGDSQILILFDYSEKECDSFIKDSDLLCTKMTLYVNKKPGFAPPHEPFCQHPIFLLYKVAEMDQIISQIKYTKDLFYTDEVVTLESQRVILKKQGLNEN